jgi:hypothetical protein
MCRSCTRSTLLRHQLDRQAASSAIALNFKWAIPLTTQVPGREAVASPPRVLMIILAVMLSLIVNGRSRSQYHTACVRWRPRHRLPPLFEDGFRYADFGVDSFPRRSGDAVLRLRDRVLVLLGPARLVMLVYSTLIALSRVYLGTHFPSDVTVGALLGVVVQLALNREYAWRRLTPVLALEKSKPAYFNAALFFVLLEMGTGFINVRDIGRSLFRLIRGLS